MAHVKSTKDAAKVGDRILLKGDGMEISKSIALAIGMLLLSGCITPDAHSNTLAGNYCVSRGYTIGYFVNQSDDAVMKCCDRQGSCKMYGRQEFLKQSEPYEARGDGQ